MLTRNGQNYNVITCLTILRTVMKNREHRALSIKLESSSSMKMKGKYSMNCLKIPTNTVTCIGIEGCMRLKSLNTDQNIEP
ncbi:hypothetical protein BTUL_0004g00960 [Botrytis tulipae]|uniref:Uncharacterized protein n=1 Tax=Botrytis tulipae TaxID=87230 RepID=A0A4Z1F7G9_9HELO|nr:hypothetical protein BTUL_0004g00960 [Botrytis tulipae]